MELLEEEIKVMVKAQTDRVMKSCQPVFEELCKDAGYFRRESGIFQRDSELCQMDLKN